MRAILASTLLPLMLASCSYSPRSTTTTSINGVDVLDSTIRETNPGSAEFSCDQSASGRCYYAVFTSTCRNDAQGTSTCTTHRIADFALARGETKSLDGLPLGYKHCVARSAPNPPACASAGSG